MPSELYVSREVKVFLGGKTAPSELLDYLYPRLAENRQGGSRTNAGRVFGLRIFDCGFVRCGICPCMRMDT